MTFSVYQYLNMAAQQLTVNTSVTLNTVPASTQWLVKDIEVANNGGAATTITLTMGGAIIFPAISIPPNQTLHWTGLRVLAAGNTIVAQASAANNLYISVDGQSGV